MPDAYRPAVSAMARMVRRARITSIFACADPVWGLPTNTDGLDHVWSHFSVRPPARLIHRDLTMTAGQRMALSRHHHETVARAVTEFGPRLLDQALTVLDADILTRAEKFVGPVRWLRGLHSLAANRVRRENHNLLWSAISLVPSVGYLHPRASVVGSLLCFTD